MLAIIATIFGFLTNFAPDLLKKWQDASDKKHELEVLKLQMQQQAAGHDYKMEEIGAQGYSAVVQAALADQSKQVENASLWVRNLSASVRPVVTYIFLSAFIFFKICIFYAVTNTDLPWQSVPLTQAIGLIWGSEELSIMGYIMGYYFGDRTRMKGK